MVPPAIATSPEIVLKSVVLPEPLGPITPMRAPGGTASVRPLSASMPSKRTVRPSISSMSAPPQIVPDAADCDLVEQPARAHDQQHRDEAAEDDHAITAEHSRRLE